MPSLKRLRGTSSERQSPGFISELADDEMVSSFESPDKRLKQQDQLSAAVQPVNIYNGYPINSAGKSYNLRRNPTGRLMDKDFIYERVFTVPKKASSNITCKNTIRETKE